MSEKKRSLVSLVSFFFFLIQCNVQLLLEQPSLLTEDHLNSSPGSQGTQNGWAPLLPENGVVKA